MFFLGFKTSSGCILGVQIFIIIPLSRYGYFFGPDPGNPQGSQYLGRTVLLLLPKLFGASLLLIMGWITAHFLKSLSFRSTTFINQSLGRLFSKGRFSRFKLSTTFINLLSKILFWVTFLFFATIATEVLGLSAFSIWLNRLAEYAPNFFAGILIVVFGVLLSTLGRDLAVSAASSTHIPYYKLLGSVIQGTILLTSIIIGLDQVGIEIGFLVTLFSIILGAILGSLALALGMGTRDLASNLISGHYLQQHYAPGQKVRLGNVEGVILEITPISVILSTEEGRMTVPAKTFHSEPSLLFIPDMNNNDG